MENNRSSNHKYMYICQQRGVGQARKARTYSGLYLKNQHTRKLISAPKASHKHNKDLSRLR